MLTLGSPAPSPQPMVAEEADMEMEEMALPDSVFEAVHLKVSSDCGIIYQACTRGQLVVDAELNPKKKTRRGAGAENERLKAEKAELLRKIASLEAKGPGGRRDVEVAHKEEIRKREEMNDEWRRTQAKLHKSKVSCLKRDHAAELECRDRDACAARDSRMRELGGQVAELRKQLSSSLAKLEAERGKLIGSSRFRRRSRIDATTASSSWSASTRSP